MRTISFLFLILSLTFCQKETSDYDVALAFPSDPPSLDPLFATDLVSQKLSKFIYAGIYEFRDSKVVPRLVKQESFYASKQGPRLDFDLDTKQAATPEDVLFSLERLLRENSPRRGDYKLIREISVNSSGKISLLLEPNTTASLIKEKLALPFATILNRKAFLENGQYTSFGNYQVAEWKKNEFLKLKLSTVVTTLPKIILIRILPQSTTSLFLYKKQKIDSLKLTDFLLTIPEADDKHTIIKRGRSIQYVAINHNNPCFDKNFRYALNFAIPRKLIISNLLENKADPVIGSLPEPFYRSLFSDLRTSKFYFDKNLSQEFLKKSACYPKILESPLEFRMRGDDENQAKGRAILQALKEIGLKVNLKGMEKAPMYKENGEGKGDLTLLTWYADYPSVWNFLDPLFHEKKLGNGGNRALYKNNKLTSRLDEKKNLNVAKDLIYEIEEDAPWIFLWSIQENYLVSDKFILHEALSDYL
jgi:peptide/nickel transport system substrate-binding protein